MTEESVSASDVRDALYAAIKDQTEFVGNLGDLESRYDALLRLAEAYAHVTRADVSTT